MGRICSRRLARLAISQRMGEATNTWASLSGYCNSFFPHRHMDGGGGWSTARNNTHSAKLPCKGMLPAGRCMHHARLIISWSHWFHVHTGRIASPLTTLPYSGDGRAQLICTCRIPNGARLAVLWRTYNWMVLWVVPSAGYGSDSSHFDWDIISRAQFGKLIERKGWWVMYMYCMLQGIS